MIAPKYVALLITLALYKQTKSDETLESPERATLVDSATLKSMVGTINQQAEMIKSLQMQQREQSNAIKRLQEDYLHTKAKTAQNSALAAFTAYPSTAITYSLGTTIQFENVVTNVGGFFNPDTGVFICPVNGLYSFFTSIFTDVDETLETLIYKNGASIVRTHSGISEQLHGVNMAVIECNALQSVYVECTGTQSGIVEGNRFTSFSGVLLVEYAV